MNSEDRLLSYVEAGVLRVDLDGSIWRCKVRHVGRGWSRWDDREPTRAESGPQTGTLVKVTAGHGLRYQTTASRLVWRVHRGPIPHGMNVYHRDFDHSNNNPDNLYLAGSGTGSRAYAMTLLNACEHRHEAMMIQALITYSTQALAAEVIGVSYTTIAKLIRRLRKRISKGDGGDA